MLATAQTLRQGKILKEKQRGEENPKKRHKRENKRKERERKRKRERYEWKLF